MRDLLYRAFNPEEGKMFYFDLRQYMQLSECGQEDLCPSLPVETLESLMEFTGQADFTEAKIFEEDIMQGPIDKALIIVKWDKSQGQWVSVNLNNGDSLPLWRLTKSFKVIGNSYESSLAKEYKIAR
ncbi:hypothetical protein Amet_2393 [Alkaliphilus metalliredigens QYMF]|uniref:YopX protein domain-containing protein n=1 Tax=Alkaliphilus metalliredigens (strain QYMF) TaxID=293826 RepID=A6TQS9_ALKMQ|nr:YopX family protein [Alkaliphilus metalliredigens]ABR48547.1 hypothetical protein Amet_2393 [Alkaliphilus metalliredigens QYMF]